ncbi:MAG: hypothetical protein JJU06_05090 [Ectothiorhodospiraceae bacterium]|nr:hypothetical protein [Ectothiorhodospiraceae bacterium]MCH8503611.1 hypothetical protein [Ectothiorhodospiraceae bacterium]
MPTWKCRLDDASLARFREELQLPHIANEVLVPGEDDLPRSHVRQVAVDSFLVLARQENPHLERHRLYALMKELRIECEPVAGR